MSTCILNIYLIFRNGDLLTCFFVDRQPSSVEAMTCGGREEAAEPEVLSLNLNSMGPAIRPSARFLSSPSLFPTPLEAENGGLFH